MFVERLLNTFGVLPYLRRRWRDDQQRSSEKVEARFDRHMATVATRLEKLDNLPRAPADTGERLEALEQSLRALSRKANRLEAALRFNAEHRERRYGSHVFDEPCVATHVAVAIDRAPLDTDPMAHLVVDGLLPRDTYAALLDAIPPAELFSDKDDRKQNFKLHAADAAPEWTVTALSFMEDVIIPRMIVPGLLQTATALLGAPYRFGGTTPQSGFDCSGFVRYVFQQYRVDVPRTAAEQFRVGRDVDATHVASGDLIFFSTTGPGATHVGIVVDPEAHTFVHAPGTGAVVRIERFDTPYWDSRTLGIRRVDIDDRY